MIRKANLSDAESIAQILVHSWQVNFKGIVPEDYLNQMNQEKISMGIRKSIEMNSLFVATAGEEIVGFAGCGSNRIQGHSQYDAELHAIHVLPGNKGSGFGRKLFNAAQNSLIEQGYKRMMLSVFEENTAKIFYEKLGGDFIGVRSVEYGGKESVERLYGWNLDWRDLK